MSRVMIDTNIWIDIILNRPDFVGNSKGAVMACLEDGDEPLIAATSIKDIFYFAAKSAGVDAGYRAVELILQVAAPAQVDGIVCKEAIGLERPDYEDGIVAGCALAEKADAIITRDKRSFNKLGIPKYSPSEFVADREYEPLSL